MVLMVINWLGLIQLVSKFELRVIIVKTMLFWDLMVVINFSWTYALNYGK